MRPILIAKPIAILILSRSLHGRFKRFGLFVMILIIDANSNYPYCPTDGNEVLAHCVVIIEYNRPYSYVWEHQNDSTFYILRRKFTYFL